MQCRKVEIQADLSNIKLSCNCSGHQWFQTGVELNCGMYKPLWLQVGRGTMPPSEAVTKALQKAAQRAAQAAADDALGASPETSESSKKKGLEEKLAVAKEKSRQVYMDIHAPFSIGSQIEALIVNTICICTSSIQKKSFRLFKLPTTKRLWFVALLPYPATRLTTLNCPVTPFGWQAAV